jgi:hypothetical protein
MGNARKRMQLPSVCRTILALTLLLLPAGYASAAATILSTGFESPFTPGNLINQFGWKAAPTNGFSTATVIPNGGVSNSQAVEVLRIGGSDRRWAVPNLVGFPSQRFVAVDWDMKVSQAPASTGFGPFFGVDTYDDSPGPQVLGSLGVDSSTGDVLYQLQDTGTLQETGVEIAFDQWTHFRIVLDFATDTYYGLVNGSVRAVTGFVDRQFGLDNFTDADIAAFAAGADSVSQSLSSRAVFDNFVVRDGLAGDYDVDGDVDSNDYSRWRATFGTQVLTPGHHADGNSNGIVDAADYVVWRNNLGTSLFSGTGTGAAVGLSAAISAVPEPSCLLLGLLGLPMIASLIRRNRRIGHAGVKR